MKITSLYYVREVIKMLYNVHLDTLIRVVETGSFRGASEKIGISPSAVLKQISLLEQDIGTKLFERGRKGVVLTEAGKSVYDDAKYMIQYSKEACERALELARKNQNVVRIGMSQLAPASVFSKYWPSVHESCPDLEFRFNCFGDTTLAYETALATLGADNDLIFGVYDEKLLDNFDLDAVCLRESKPLAAFGFDHPLGKLEKSVLTLSDLREYPLLLQRKGLMNVTDRIREMAVNENIQIEDIDIYDLELRYRLHHNNNAMIVFNVWQAAAAVYSTKELDCGVHAYYGAIISRSASDSVRNLAAAIGKACTS